MLSFKTLRKDADLYNNATKANRDGRAEKMAFWVDLRTIISASPFFEQIVETSGNPDKAKPQKRKNVKRYWPTTTFAHLDKMREKTNVPIFFYNKQTLFWGSRK